MTNNRLNTLERETPNAQLCDTWGTSPAATRATNKESATALTVTLSDIENKRGCLTVQDLIRHASSESLDLSALTANVDRLMR